MAFFVFLIGDSFFLLLFNATGAALAKKSAGDISFPSSMRLLSATFRLRVVDAEEATSLVECFWPSATSGSLTGGLLLDTVLPFGLPFPPLPPAGFLAKKLRMSIGIVDAMKWVY